MEVPDRAKEQGQTLEQWSFPSTLPPGLPGWGYKCRMLRQAERAEGERRQGEGGGVGRKREGGEGGGEEGRGRRRQERRRGQKTWPER